jgi:peroxiredoxin
MRTLGTLHSLLVAMLLVVGVTSTSAASGPDVTATQPPLSQINGSISNRSVVPQQGNVWTQGAFSLRGLDGVMHSLADWKGKVIMLNFWATWCAPCQAEIADFIALQEEYQADGLQIIGLGLDEEKKLRNVQRTLEINYPILIADPERNSKLMGQWGNSNGIVPYTVVIDRDGRIRYIHHGPLHRDTFDENIRPLLARSK